MGTDADVVITALQAGADHLVPIVRTLTAEQLTAPSAAADWDVSQVLSHLGSGGALALAALDAALAGQPNPGMDMNRAVWATWDAMSPQERADGFVASNARLLDRYHGIGEPARASLRVDLGFLPAPVDLATAAKFRLNEYTLHSWDVRVAFDPAAVLQPAAVPLLLDLVAPMVGWLARPAPLEGRSVTVRVDLRDPERSLVLALGEQTSIAAVPADAAPAKVDGVLALPAEAWLRLVAGRLKPPYTPCGAVAATGVSLDTLRAVFAGY